MTHSADLTARHLAHGPWGVSTETSAMKILARTPPPVVAIGSRFHFMWLTLHVVGVVRAIETAYVLVELERKTNADGSPQRKWIARALFGNNSPLVYPA